jgi:transcription antitermination factor NusG
MDFRKLDNQWFALQVRARFEDRCARALRGKGYEEFLPLCKFISRGHDAESLKRPKPLFPGYVFCKFKHDAKGPVVTTPGVIRPVGFGGMPCPINEEEIENIRRVVDSECPALSWPYVPAGHVLRITRGPLSGVTGTLVRVKNVHRLVVSIDLLKRSAAVEVDAECVSTADPITENVSAPSRLVDAANGCYVAADL